MPLGFLLLHIANAALAGSTLWIRFRHPELWGGQGLVLTVLVGMLLASISALLLGLLMVFSQEARWKSLLAQLVLVLSFAGIQGYVFYLATRDTGLLHYLKTRLAG